MTEPTAAPPPRRLSLFLWASGAALWLIVLVMFATLYLRGPKTAGVAPDENAAPSVATSADAPAPSASQAAPGGLVSPAAIWDADGVADFTLTERSGKEVKQDDLLGRPWVVGFIFTRCTGPCPRVTAQMRKLQDQFKDQDVRLVTMTVDPDYDTPVKLADYAEAFGADPDRWLFLTGDKETMYRYIEKNFKMPVAETEGEDRKPGSEVIHTTNLLLVDAKGVVRGKYNALADQDMAKLKLDVKKLES